MVNLIGGGNRTFDNAPNTITILDTLSYNVGTYAGNDVVTVNPSVTSSAVSNFYLGAGADSFTGSVGMDQVYDGSGGDHVMLGGGNDTVSVGAGNDFYDGGAGAGDFLSFLFASYDFPMSGATGQVLNTASVTVDLALTSAQNFGVFGFDTIRNFEGCYGGAGADRIFGSGVTNILYGGTGGDTIYGRGGVDLINGGDGGDTIVGGPGGDSLAGGATGNFIFSFDAAPDLARDIFRYFAASDSTLDLAQVDQIREFRPGTAASCDRIDLSPMDANSVLTGNNAFIWRGTAAAFGTDAMGEVRIQVSGASTLIQVDTDNDINAEMTIVVFAALSRADIIL